jgi:3-oxoacyl-[acyl-carrier protein] reductase
MNIILTNKNAMVGGSTQGLGKAIALQLAACGANITLVARNEEKLKNTIAQLDASQGQQHQYVVCDFSDYESYKTIITSFLATHPIDILVNNTNGPTFGGVLEKNADDYQATFDLLFKTVCTTTLAALPYMQKNGYGRIINLSSISIKEPLAHLTLSNTVRAAVINWAKTLATEVAKNNITVNNILTGYFDTERLNNIFEYQAEMKQVSAKIIKENMLAPMPMKRLGAPKEFGYLVAFLASEYAAYITGTNIPIDGGLLKSS